MSGGSEQASEQARGANAQVLYASISSSFYPLCSGPPPGLPSSNAGYQGSFKVNFMWTLTGQVDSLSVLPCAAPEYDRAGEPNNSGVGEGEVKEERCARIKLHENDLGWWR